MLTQPGKAKGLIYLSMLWLLVCSALMRTLGSGPNASIVVAFASWLGLAWLIRRRWRDPQIIAEGQLLSTSDSLLLTIGEQEMAFPLDAATLVKITYQGFKGEQLAPRIWASGIDNFIQVNGGETYRFAMPTAQSQSTLRAELRRWYLLKVQVKEHRRDGPTFLLHRDLSYEQIQSYKQEFGVSLYN